MKPFYAIKKLHSEFFKSTLRTSMSVKRFIYSEYFVSGLRKGIGILLPVIVLLIMQQPLHYGIIATMGALGVSILDQPGPLKHRITEMIVCALFNTLVVWLTAYFNTNGWWLFIQTVIIVFFLAMLNVYGKLGAMLGTATLLLLTITLQTHIPSGEVTTYALISLSGGLAYALFSGITNRITAHRQEKKLLTVNLYQLANYLRARVDLYDPNKPLEASYRNVVKQTITLIDSQDTIRNILLRPLPLSSNATLKQKRQRLVNLFILAVDIHDNAISNQTNHQLFLDTFKTHPLLPAIQHFVKMLSDDVATIASCLAQHKKPRAIDQHYYAWQLCKNAILQASLEHQGSTLEEYLQQLLTRLTQAHNLVSRLRTDARIRNKRLKPILSMDSELKKFLQKDNITLTVLWQNFRFNSPIFKFAIRLCTATAIAWLITHSVLIHVMGHHSYWILLTIFMIMKPSFGMSHTRNIGRLIGTAVGCIIIVLILQQSDTSSLILSIMFISIVLANTFTTLNYATSTVFNTIFALLALHLIAPEPLTIAGERLIDTIIGGVIVFACSFILPVWESQRIYTIFKRTLASQRNLLSYFKPNTPSVIADIEYRLERKNAIATLNLFSSAYYRMLDEPKRTQVDVLLYHDLVIDTHRLNTLLLTLIQQIKQSPTHNDPDQLQSLALAQGYLNSILDNTTLPPSTFADIWHPPVLWGDILSVCQDIQKHARELQNRT